MGVSKTIEGPSSNGTNVTMVKEIEFHVTEKYVEVSLLHIIYLNFETSYHGPPTNIHFFISTLFIFGK